MAKTTSEEEFVGGGLDKRQAETQAAAFKRTRHHPSDISTLKWATGLFAAAVIAGFGWIGSEIRETRASLSTRIGGVEARVESLGTRIDDLAIDVARVEARVDSLETRIDDLAIGMARVEAHVDSLETRIEGLATGMARVEASIEALSERQARIETLLDKRLPSQL